MAEIKQSINSVQIVGTLKEINAKVEEKEVTIKKGNVEKKVTCNQISKKEFSNPMFVIEVNGNDIGVDYFPTAEKKLDDDNKIVDNPRYKSLETIINTYIPKSKDAENATRVKVDGNLRLNEYANKEYKWTSFQVVNGFAMTSTGVPEEDVADAEFSGVLYNVAPEMVGEKETDRLIATICTFDNQGVVSPMKLTIPSDLAEDFNEFYEIGDNAQFSYEITTKLVGTPKPQQSGGFGKRESKIVRGFNVTEFLFFYGSDRFEEENELFISPSVVKEAMDARNIMIEKKIEEKKNEGSTTSSPKGASAKSTSSANPFGGGSATSTESKRKNPFA